MGYKHSLKLISKLVIFSMSILLFFTACKRHLEEVDPNKRLSNNSTALVSNAVYVIKSTETVIDNAVLKIAPGSVVGIAAGIRGQLQLRNFAGMPGSPITFINMNGKVTIQETAAAGYGIKTENCKCIRITGTGDSKTPYGIEVNGPHIGITFEQLSTDFELDHTEVHNIGFAGIMGKTDPTCDASTWRGNFLMKNLSLHDNYVHETTGEGFYIGNSFYANGHVLACGTVLPHEVNNVKVFDNKIFNSGCEGIQVGCTTQGMEIFRNSVQNYGQSPFANGQANGIQVGEGSAGLVYNNVINTGPSNGLIMLGIGNTRVYNNVILNAGENGVFCDNRGPASGEIAFLYNTIVNPKQNAVKMYNELTQNKFYNNIMVGGTGFVVFQSGATGDQKNNYTNADAASVQFVNLANNDLHLKSTSPAVDQGLDVSSYGITYDDDSKVRISGTKPDMGALEYQVASITKTPTPLTGNPTGADGLVINPSDDAYLSDGIVDNSNIIQTLAGRKVAYFKFVLSNMKFAVTSAKIRLKVGSNAGSAILRIFRGSSSNWAESTLSALNAPTATGLAAMVNGTFVTAGVVEFDVTSSIASNGTYTFILSEDIGGSDISFSSKEGWQKPELVIN